MATDILELMNRQKIPTEVTAQLYVGNYSASRNFEFIDARRITHILTVAVGIDPEYPTNCTYKIVNVDDWHEEDLSKYFAECFNFIDEAHVAGGSVLVHCQAGISRSPAIVIGYLMYRYCLSLSEAYHIVKLKRPNIGPNAGFLAQLGQLEKVLLSTQQGSDCSSDTNNRIDTVPTITSSPYWRFNGTDRPELPLALEETLQSYSPASAFFPPPSSTTAYSGTSINHVVTPLNDPEAQHEPFSATPGFVETTQMPIVIPSAGDSEQ